MTTEKPETLDDGYVWVVVNQVNPDKRSFAESDDVAELTMELLAGPFELRIIDTER